MSEDQDVSKSDRQADEIIKLIDARNRGYELVSSALSDRVSRHLGREACEELLAELRRQLESQTEQADPDTRRAVHMYLANFEKAMNSSAHRSGDSP